MDKNTEPPKNNTPPADDIWPEGREFELEVFDMSIDDNTGKTIPQRVSYDHPVIVKVFSKSELNGKLALYKSCDQVARILREIPSANRQQKPIQQPAQQNPIVQQSQMFRPMTQQAPVIPQQAIQQQSQPQYYRIGDIEIKIENGQSYQKQFVKLTESEARNIRIVDDKTNRVVNLNGKHIEMKKWIQVQSSTTDELSTLEENISDKKD